MTHSMQLTPSPFQMIKEGTKTIELRLFDEKRRKIQIGDIIEFSNTDTELEESNNNSKTTYKVNGEEVSKEDYEKALEKFNNKYMNNIQDMLLNHMEFVNEMYNFARLFNW